MKLLGLLKYDLGSEMFLSSQCPAHHSAIDVHLPRMDS